LTATGDQLWDQNSTGIQDTAETNDCFGAVLTAGNFDGDSYADLAVGVPFEDVGSVVNAGAVSVLRGAPRGLTATGNQLWDQDVNNVGGVAEAGDGFGYTLTAGDFDGDGRADLAVGVPYEDVGNAADAGAVNILYGSTTGLTAIGNQVLDQDSSGAQETAESDDGFGFALAAGDFNGDGYADLAVGVPFEDIGSPVINDAGTVQVVYGSAAGLVSTGNQLWHQDIPSMAGAAEAGDNFGDALAAIPRTTHRTRVPLVVRP
jgi:hypothetical protein